MIFDIVICHGPNDDNLLNLNLEYNKKNIVNYRNIYVITYDKELKRDDCIIIHESSFIFNKDNINKIVNLGDRCGWYLQQLLKLYVWKVIPNISEYYLVLDCDTIFLKPIEFFEKNVPLYNYGEEYHKPYFEHMKRLDINFTRTIKKSGICHHMIFNKNILKEIFLKVENNRKGKEFWEIFLECIDKKQWNESGASEYEIYFHYIIKNHSDKMKIRKLNWKNVKKIESNYNYDYISYHWYNRS